MSTFQLVLRHTASAVNRLSAARLYERFANWWAGLYAEQQRPPRTIL